LTELKVRVMRVWMRTKRDRCGGNGAETGLEISIGSGNGYKHYVFSCQSSHAAKQTYSDHFTGRHVKQANNA